MKFAADPRTAVFLKSANPFNFPLNSAIRLLFKAKSVNPRTYSPPSALLLLTLQPPLDDGTFPLQHRLFPDFRGCPFYGRDVFSLISGQAWLFWRNTGDTPGSFLRLALDLLPSLWTASHYPTPSENNLNQPSST